ncbi:MAG: hypothetical protein ABH986_05530 [archaeon]
MGLTDMFKKKEEEKQEPKEAVPEGKYNQACALCGAEGTEKKWAGQYWHKKCMRKSRKMARGMF